MSQILPLILAFLLFGLIGSLLSMARLNIRQKIAHKYIIILAFIILLMFFLLRFALEPVPIDKYNLLIDLLGILIPFATMLGGIVWYILREQIKTDKEELKQEILKTARAERQASRAESRGIQSYIFSKLYNEKNPRTKHFIKIAWQFDEQAFNDIQNLDPKIYADIIIKIKNNYINYLIEQVEFKKKTRGSADPFMEEQILKLSNELWQSIISRQVYQFYTKEFICHLKETCARTLFYFEKKQKALQIIRAMREDAPRDWYQKIKIKYKL